MHPMELKTLESELYCGDTINNPNTCDTCGNSSYSMALLTDISSLSRHTAKRHEHVSTYCNIADIAVSFTE